MKNLAFLKSRVTMTLLFIFSFYYSKSQFSDYEWERPMNDGFPFIMYTNIHNCTEDKLIATTAASNIFNTDNYIDYSLRLVFQKHPFQFLKIDTLHSNTNELVHRIQYIKHNHKIFEVQSILDGDQNGKVVINQLDKDLNFVKELAVRNYNDHYVKSVVGFVQNKFIISTTSVELTDAEIRFEVIDTNGINFSERLIDSNTTYTPIPNVFTCFRENPRNSNSFYVATNSPFIWEIDFNKLDTLSTIDVDGPLNMDIWNKGYALFRPTEFTVENQSFVFGGWGTRIDDLLNSDFEEQQLFLRYYPATDSLEVKDFGLDNMTTSSVFSNNSKTFALVGAAPYDAVTTFASEKRELQLYVFDDFGKKDSLFIYGNKNHMPSDLLLDENGDVYISGSYNNAWTDLQAYGFVVKVPGIATSVLKEEGRNRDLFLFPNPAQSNLNIKNSTQHFGETYKVISQEGKLVKQGTINSATLDVSNLSSGSYFLLVGENKNQLNGLFMKQ